jgi:hypothetical protein
LKSSKEKLEYKNILIIMYLKDINRTITLIKKITIYSQNNYFIILRINCNIYIKAYASVSCVASSLFFYQKNLGRRDDVWDQVRENLRTQRALTIVITFTCLQRHTTRNLSNLEQFRAIPNNREQFRAIWKIWAMLGFWTIEHRFGRFEKLRMKDSEWTI